MDFFIDVIVSGSVAGVGLADSPEAVAQVLGSDFTEEVARMRLRRDYGLVEFFWERSPGPDRWHAAGFALQVHRLASGADVIEELVRRYGRFGLRLPFARLNAELARLGYPLTETTGDADQPDWRRYWLAEARVSVIVAAAPWGALLAGDVFSIHGSHPAQAMAAGMGGQRQAIKDGLCHLLRLGSTEREDWLDRRQPASDGRVNWWLYLLLVIDTQIGSQPAQRPEWVDLSLWLLHQGHTRDVFTTAEYAEKLAYFVLRVRHTGTVSPGLPSADDVVRACLQAIPVDPEQAVARGSGRDLVNLDPAQMRRSRQARILVNAAQWHLGAVRDRRLAGQLREWIALKPRLV